MKKIQGKKIVGYVLIHIKGPQPEVFLKYCIKNKIIIWDMKRIDSTSCLAKVSWLKVNQIKQLSESLSFEIEIRESRGLFPFITKFGRKKEILIAMVLSLLCVFVLSNMVWKVEVTGVSKELDVKIREELKNNGFYVGAWGYGIENLDVIGQRLLNKIPDLLYIGIYKQGTTYQVDAIEKLTEKKESQGMKQQLTAAKNGVIQKMYITSGVPQVQVQDFVKKGDLLVSGVIKLDNEEANEQDTDKKTKDKWVGANGKVYANTWYDVKLSIPLYSETEKLTGDSVHRYGVEIGKFQFPIWGFWNYKNEDSITEREYSRPKLFSWNIPVLFWEEAIYDKNSLSLQRSEKEAKHIALEYLSSDLPRQLGKDAEILNYNVLHESVDNGKVNLNLYISVLEDIAEGQKAK